MIKNLHGHISHNSHESSTAFSIGSLDVKVYALTMLSGMILAILTIAWFWKKEKYSWDLLQLLIIVIIPTSIIGARLWYVLGDLEKFTSGNARWYAFWEGGLAIQGGVTFSATAGLIVVYFNRTQVDWRKVVGIILPSVLIGQSIGRWGNFANHEVYGTETSYESVAWLGNWIASNMFIDGAYRTPLFFYESITSLIGYVVLVWVAQYYMKFLKPGVPAAFYLIWYGIVRISMEPLRDESDIMRWGIIPVSMFFSALYISFGILTFIWFQFLTKVYNFDKEKNEWQRKMPIVKRRMNLTSDINKNKK